MAGVKVERFYREVQQFILTPKDGWDVATILKLLEDNKAWRVPELDDEKRLTGRIAIFVVVNNDDIAADGIGEAIGWMGNLTANDIDETYSVLEC